MIGMAAIARMNNFVSLCTLLRQPGCFGTQSGDIVLFSA
jgi:hypothetical protein